jgi:stage II sporulation protein AA (anti-sigma F factor antagonist)
MTSTAPRPPDDLPVGELLTVETIRFDERRAAVAVHGDLDVSTAAELWSVLQRHLTAGRRYLRVDLAAVKFIDAAAVTAIVEVHHEALYRRGTLVLVGVTPPVAKVFALTGVDETLFITGPSMHLARTWEVTS